MKKTFEEVVKQFIGKSVVLYMIAEGQAYSVEGTLTEVNSDHLVVEDEKTKSTIYINLVVSSLSHMEVFP